uniref:Mucin-19-like isoform X1 n=1 Tax=Petromyzon marinus TaxID=7757 RepID=A0AAJ7T560_PETMA|nr:mucin-19-like isoform X1 [Petromyzon marinus]
MDPSNGQSSSSAGFIIKDVTSLQDSACQTLTNLSGRYPRARRSAPPRRRPKATITTATTTTTASSSATTSSSFTSSAPASSSTTSGPFSPRSNTALRPIAKRCAPVPTHASTSAPAATNYRTPVASVPKYRPIRPRPMDPSRERSRPFDAAAAAAAAAATIANVAAGPALAEQGSHRYQAVAANCQSAAGTRAPLNLRAFLQRRAPHLFEACQSTGMLSQSSRKELVKLAVSHLVERHGLYVFLSSSTVSRCGEVLSPNQTDGQMCIQIYIQIYRQTNRQAELEKGKNAGRIDQTRMQTCGHAGSHTGKKTDIQAD